MIVLGVVLLIAGFFLGIPLLTVAGFLVLILGAVLLVAGSTGHPMGGRRHYY
ncbi:DUF6131 family protein [Nocardia suismassiliense]|uniref:DUF6131 family protein n=1 Tax=Nocardia suismassiliense TaxID=2077092 RepID=A0ABW6QVF0_9NOCA|nr:DUF6131 family protein [Nocardia sp. XZ_19_369]